MNKAIAERKTGYCPAAGIPELRTALASSMGSARGGTCVNDFDGCGIRRFIPIANRDLTIFDRNRRLCAIYSFLHHGECEHPIWW